MLNLNSTIFILNPVPKIPISCKRGMETSKCFVLNESRCTGVLKNADSEFDNYFLKSHPQDTYFGKLGPKTLKCFVSNETRYVRVFKSNDSEFDNYFLKSRPTNICFGQAFLCFSF